LSGSLLEEWKSEAGLEAREKLLTLFHHDNDAASQASPLLRLTCSGRFVPAAPTLGRGKLGREGRSKFTMGGKETGGSSILSGANPLEDAVALFLLQVSRRALLVHVILARHAVKRRLLLLFVVLGAE
jgi:hypothetical protein